MVLGEAELVEHVGKGKVIKQQRRAQIVEKISSLLPCRRGMIKAVAIKQQYAMVNQAQHSDKLKL